MEEALIKDPNKFIEVLRMLEDGDMVANEFLRKMTNPDKKD